MGFFDLNIPYLEGGGSEKSVPDKSRGKNARLKVVVKAMELGYTGVAYNRSMKGVMSDSDRCTISLFPLSSLLKASPTLSSSVQFHRGILGVPLTSPFRQYTRLTVAVDTPVQADALNSGNPVLKTYDLVAVRPLNQLAFERACKVSEVDLIAIDFSQKLPFRLKLPMVKAAIERGICFEISYSHLISDVQARRQLISNAKLLVDWTRGKNLVFSSAASTANEFRGPYDVANLSTLLGLSMERAKAAISKNCRSLIANALRKRHWFKEAIKVERISSGEQIDPKEPWFVDWHNWDNISSGEGDLLLDDIAKFFSASSKAPKTSKAVDFTSIAEGMLSNDMKSKDSVSVSGFELQSPDDTSNLLSTTAQEFEGSAVADEFSKVPHSDWKSLPSISLKHQTSGCELLLEPMSPNNNLTDTMEIENPKPCNEEPKNANGSDVRTSSNDTPLQECITGHETNLVSLPTSAKDILPSATFNADSTWPSMLDLVSPSTDFVSASEGDLVSPIDILENFTPKQIGPPNLYSERSKCPDVVLSAQDVRVEEVLTKTEEQKQTDFSLVACDVYLHGVFAERKKCGGPENTVAPLTDDMPSEKTYNEIQGDVVMVAGDQRLEDVLVETEEWKQGEGFIKINHPTLDKSKSGKVRLRKKPRQAFLFPFNRLLKPVLFKKKSRKLKTR